MVYLNIENWPDVLCKLNCCYNISRIWCNFDVGVVSNKQVMKEGMKENK
jgi:hypothetical protein